MPKKKDAGDDRLMLKYVSLSTIAKWDNNKKKHDIKKIIASLKKHGFKDPLKYEPALNAGNGGIVEGNGRTEALQTMKNQSPKSPPRGIYIDGNEWMIPVLFGVDSDSQNAAEAYGMDHNNLTVGGSDISFNDMLSMWDDSIVDDIVMLQGEGNMPVSITEDGLDALLDAGKEKLTEKEEEIRAKDMLRILVSVPASVVLDVQDHIKAIEKIPGVEIDYSGN